MYIFQCHECPTWPFLRGQKSRDSQLCIETKTKFKQKVNSQKKINIIQRDETIKIACYSKNSLVNVVLERQQLIKRLFKLEVFQQQYCQFINCMHNLSRHTSITKYQILNDEKALLVIRSHLRFDVMIITSNESPTKIISVSITLRFILNSDGSRVFDDFHLDLE